MLESGYADAGWCLEQRGVRYIFCRISKKHTITYVRTQHARFKLRFKLKLKLKRRARRAVRRRAEVVDNNYQ